MTIEHFHIPELSTIKDVDGQSHYFFNMEYIGKRVNDQFIPNDQCWYYDRNLKKFKVKLPK